MLAIVPMLGAVELIIDRYVDGVYVLQFANERPRVVGSVGGYGALMAVNLADAYRPEGVPR